MKLEDQVCSLKDAKKLAALGVKHEAHFKHVKVDGVFIIVETRYAKPAHGGLKIGAEYPAYTAAELGEMFSRLFIPPFRTSEGEWVLPGVGGTVFLEGELSEADARALYLIALIEGKHLTAKEINNVR